MRALDPGSAFGISLPFSFPYCPKNPEMAWPAFFMEFPKELASALKLMAPSSFALRASPIFAPSSAGGTPPSDCPICRKVMSGRLTETVFPPMKAALASALAPLTDRTPTISFFPVRFVFAGVAVWSLEFVWRETFLRRASKFVVPPALS